MSISDRDLKQIALKHKIPLIDVFMKDEPPNKIYEGGYIINMADAQTNNGGTHWVALFIPSHDKTIGYMDSFGFIPPQSIINWIKKTGLNKYKIAYNTKQIQNINSGGCGIYSLFFIDFMSRLNKNVSIENGIEQFDNLFDNDNKKNLTILKSLVPYYHNT